MLLSYYIIFDYEAITIINFLGLSILRNRAQPLIFFPFWRLGRRTRHPPIGINHSLRIIYDLLLRNILDGNYKWRLDSDYF